MCINRTNITHALAIALFLLSHFSPAQAQDNPLPEGFIGRGIAQINAGDVEAARQQALGDAQGKALMEAVLARVPLDVMEKNFLLLKKNFFDKSAAYIQSFKVVYENTSFDFYQITIQALVQQELLRKDLDTLVFVGTPREPRKVLLMIAEKMSGSNDFIFWWAQGSAAKIPESELILKEKCAEKDFMVVDPLQTLKEPPASSPYFYPEPDIDTVCRIGALCGADIAIVGKAEIERSRGTDAASFSAFQCNLKANAISVKDRKVMVSAAAYGLGVNADEVIAYRSAVDKAGRQLLNQIADKLMLLPH
jgi:hypothetical protein